MTVTVDPLPPAADPSADGGDAPGADGAPAPGAPTETLATGDWTEADVAKLKDLVAAPYKMLADSTGEPWLELTDLQALAIAVPMTSWLPVSMVRGGDGQKIPPLLGSLLTAGAFAGITGMKIAQWNRAHPDRFVAVPFITKRGARRGPSTPAHDPRARDERVERPDDAGDRIEAAEPATEPAAAGARDGGPAADSIDDIRRGYTS